LPEQPQYRDRVVLCRDCRQEFTFSAGEQRFFEQRGLNAPRRCPVCREEKRKQGTYGSQVVPVDSPSGLVLCRRCSRPASRNESLRTGQAICHGCAIEDPNSSVTPKEDVLTYEEWAEYYRKKGN
jgi:hypothetical protein